MKFKSDEFRCGLETTSRLITFLGYILVLIIILLCFISAIMF